MFGSGSAAEYNSQGNQVAQKPPTVSRNGNFKMFPGKSAGQVPSQQSKMPS